jgi:hypothetical protein
VRQQQIRRRAARSGGPEAEDAAPPVPYGGRRAAHLADLVLAEIDAALAAS